MTGAFQRIDARAKVTGALRYAVDDGLPGMAHAVVVTSRVSRGRVVSVEAGRGGGVLAVLSAPNAPRLKLPEPLPTGSTAAQHGLLQHPEVHYLGQPVAVVVAETALQAEAAALRLRVAYEALPVACVLDEAPAQPVEDPPRDRGDAVSAMATAPVQAEVVVRTAANLHAPLGLPAALAWWDAGDLRVHDTTQNLTAAARTLAQLFGLDMNRVHVTCPAVGGAFGAYIRQAPVAALATMAAMRVGRPVRLTVQRAAVAALCGHRAETRQTLRLGCDAGGRLLAVDHDILTATSRHDTFVDAISEASRGVYACPAVRTTQRAAALDRPTPTWVRGIGMSPGNFAMETALDALAHRAGLDPIALRLANIAAEEPESGRPWSSNGMAACLRDVANRAEWSARRPRAEGRLRIGKGVASAYHGSGSRPASARARVFADGTASVEIGVTDVGPGSGTVLALTAARALGLDPAKVTVTLGSNALPPAPGQSASATVASAGSAVHAAATRLRETVLRRAGEPVATAAPDYRALMAALGEPVVEASADYRPRDEEATPSSSFGAHVVEVEVDAELQLVRVRRVWSSFDIGRVADPPRARGQALGGVLFGIGQTLMEHLPVDRKRGGFTGSDLGAYHVATQVDAPAIEVAFLETEDHAVGLIGTKGLGELPVTGIAAAISNAVFAAIGERVLRWPMLPGMRAEAAASASASVWRSRTPRHGEPRET